MKPEVTCCSRLVLLLDEMLARRSRGLSAPCCPAITAPSSTKDTGLNPTHPGPLTARATSSPRLQRHSTTQTPLWKRESVNRTKTHRRETATCCNCSKTPKIRRETATEGNKETEEIPMPSATRDTSPLFPNIQALRTAVRVPSCPSAPSSAPQEVM